MTQREKAVQDKLYSLNNHFRLLKIWLTAEEKHSGDTRRYGAWLAGVEAWAFESPEDVLVAAQARLRTMNGSLEAECVSRLIA
jgi:hypothetical protein